MTTVDGAPARRQDPAALLHAAGARCTCSGECGRTHHTIDTGQCSRTTNLIAAPRDLTVTSPTAACQAELTVWCRPCHKSAVSKAAPIPSKPEADSLF